jgi:phage tail sheath protein FI
MSKLLVVAVLAVSIWGGAQTSHPTTVAPAIQKAPPAHRTSAEVKKYLEGLKPALEKKISFASTEANDEKLWAATRQMVESDLLADWTAGILLGNKPQQAFFVKCDRTTMSQNDLDNGRMVVLVGVATVKPAEFEIIRITQSTADSRKKPGTRPRKP